MHDYLNLEVLKRARRLIPVVYELTAGFPADERYVLVQQMRRSVHSIGANIAEGAGRRTRGEFRQFVSQAAGSTFELEWHILVSTDLGYLTASANAPLLDELGALKRMLYRLGETLR